MFYKINKNLNYFLISRLTAVDSCTVPILCKFSGVGGKESATGLKLGGGAKTSKLLKIYCKFKNSLIFSKTWGPRPPGPSGSGPMVGGLGNDLFVPPPSWRPTVQEVLRRLNQV